MSRPDLCRSRTLKVVSNRKSNPAAVEALEGRTLLSAGSDPMQVLIGAGAAKSVQFTDVSGTQAKVFLTGPGTATVTFNGTSLSQSANAAGLVINGTGVTLGTIDASGTTTRSTLQIQTHGRDSIAAGGISASGSLSAILAPHVVVTGDISTSGWVHHIQLAGAQAGTITVGPSHINGTLILNVGAASDESVNSSIRISSLTSNQWINTTATPQTIQAPQVDNLNVKGNFAPGLTLTGVPGGKPVLGHFAAGAIVSGTWNISGNAGVVQAGSIASGWVATVSDNVNVINVSHDATVDLTASTINSINVHGTLANSSIVLLNPLTARGFNLNNLSVRGGIVSSTIRSIGSIGTITAGQMQDSDVYAGLVNFPSGQNLPEIATDFTNVAQIKSVSLRRSASASFTGSSLGAYAIGSVNLGTVSMANGGTAFGVGAHSVKLVSLTDQTTGKSVRMANVPSTGAFTNLLVSKGITPVDFVVRIV